MANVGIDWSNTVPEQFQLALGIDFDPDPIWCGWFSGLVDGEGCFTFSATKNTMNITCRLRIKMRDDESSFLQQELGLLRCGCFYRTPARGNKNPQIEWCISDIGSICHIIIPILDRYPLRLKKQRDYEIWRQAARIILIGGHLNGYRDYVLDLKKQLSEVRKYCG